MKRTFNDKYTKQDGEVVRYQNTRAYLKCNEARYRETACSNPAHIRYDVVEKTVLDNALPLIAKHKDEKKILGVFDARMAEIQRDIEVKQQHLNNIVEALTENPTVKAFAKKAADLEAEIDVLTADNASVKRQRDIEAAKPAKNEDVTLIDAMRAELISDDDDVRFEARARINSLLARLLKAVYINDDRTFTVEVDDGFSATYDADGNAIGYRLSGDRIVDEMDEALLTDDREAIVDEAFKRIRV